MVWIPVPATAGSNVPAVPLVMPVPVHVPPGEAAVMLNAGELMHFGPTFVIVALYTATTVTTTVSTSPHGAPMVYVMMCGPAPAVAGLNVPAAALVMPVPVHVPPGSTAVRLNAGAEIHCGG